MIRETYKTLSVMVLFLVVAGVFFRCSTPTEPGIGFGKEKVFATHREADVIYKSSDGTILSGTLLLPLAQGPYPAVVAHFGSDRWTRYRYNGWTKVWLDREIAVLTYDKRGVGESGGKCCPWKEPGYFPLLAEDVLAGVRTLQTHQDIDTEKIGLYGFSQGGWVIPVAAAKASDEVAFIMIGSGPTVTLGEELLYSSLTGESQCQPTGLSDEEIECRLDEAGPSGFDPQPFLKQMTTPAYWMYCSNDASVPVQRSISILDSIKVSMQKNWTIDIFPNCNHVFIVGGSICQSSGQTYNWVTPAFDWLLLQLDIGK